MDKKILTVLLLLLVACQKDLGLKSVNWSIHSKRPNPIFENLYFKNSESPVRVFGEIVERSQQNINGAKIEGSYLQKVFSTNGELQYMSGKYEDFAADEKLKRKAQDLDISKYKALEIIKRKYLPLSKASSVYPPEAVVTIENKIPKFHWIIDYIDLGNAGVYRMKVTDQYTIESVHRIETCFQEKKSVVFPFGPKLSGLQEELLRGLFGDGSLANSKFVLTSNDGLAVREENGGFTFDPNDNRFDHTQSYFFLQKTLDFAENYWQFNLPFSLRVQLRAGYPEKTNTAFYYKGQIRVGEGDGISYQAIPRDPSIISHEVMHSVIETISGMGTDEEAGCLNEGFADFLTAAIWDNPYMGHTAYKKGPFKRTVLNTLTLADKNGGLYHDSGILSGTFWEIRAAVGSERSQRLALKTMIRLSVAPRFSDLKPAVFDSMKSMGWSAEDTARVSDILASRGW